MSLIDRLREVENFTPSAQPTAGELLEIVGKLAAYVEHGDEFLDAAAADAEARQTGQPANAVNDLLSPPPPDRDGPAEAPPAASPAASATDADKDAQIASLEQQVATLRAQSERTQVTTEPDPQSGPHPDPSGGAF
jgi:hypothetical protein